MATQIEQRTVGDKTYNNINLSDLGVGDGFKAKIKFEAPLEKTGQYGQYYIFNVELLEPKALESASFIAKGYVDGEKGVKLADKLSGLPVDTVFEVTRVKPREGAPGRMTLWEVKVADAASAPKTTAEGEYGVLVDLLVKNSKGEKQTDQWIIDQLKSVGIDDYKMMVEIKDLYVNRW